MNRVPMIAHSHENSPWSTLADIPPNMLRKLLEPSINHPTTARVLSKDDLSTSLTKMELALSIIHHEYQCVSRFITRPHSFLFSESQGYVLSTLNAHTDLNIELGTSFNIVHMGTNAIGLAKEMNKMSLVIGKEHTIKTFWQYSCVCTPIRIESNVIGFLDLTFLYTEDLTFSLPMMNQLSINIEERLIKLCPNFQKEKIFALFQQCNLTSREKEIAFGWLNNLSCEEIACKNSITPHTVRTYIKKIYAKTDTISKGEFFSKFSI